MKNSKLSEIFMIHEENSGPHFLLTIKPQVKTFSAQEIQQKWKKGGINIQLLSEYFYAPKPVSGIESFVVNYSGIKRDCISEIIQKMSSALFDD